MEIVDVKYHSHYVVDCECPSPKKINSSGESCAHDTNKAYHLVAPSFETEVSVASAAECQTKCKLCCFA